MTTHFNTRLASFQATQQSNLLSFLLSHLTGRAAQPNYPQYLTLNKALQCGDPQMEKVLTWMMLNPKQHREYFEIALFKGVEQLPFPIPELEHFFKHVEQIPPWLEPEKIQQAIEFTHRLGINNGFILRDLSLMVGYLFPGFNQPLMLTGALNKQAGTRLAETTKWWVDITEECGLERLHAGFTSTIYVRFIHALVRHQLQKGKDWDFATWGAPMNQFDLAMTNLAFSSVVLLGIRALGIFPSKQETESFLHFWRYVGWLMGIDEKWLIEKESDGWKLLYWMQFVHPQSDASSMALGASLSKEPFERQYKYLRPFQQKLAYRQHLELTQFFIGKKRMHKLGLKPQSAAWFAYYLLARNLVLYSGAKHVPSLNQKLQQKGRAIQKLGLALYQSKAKQLASMHQ
ncbi:oxygenase MpaB family protein [Acinetobacter sp. YH12069]|uniref:oxygenase MpaB family protein n=1 Tax=Acinetobacter sp. YH12069 TaxID=2601065 RepID=UPI0015D45580|nr:oxygenase MpaB family protein [Acinetobacter sp. YH12069]